VRGSRELSDQYAHAREDAGYGHHDHAFGAVPFAPAQVEFVAQYARTDARTVNDDPRCGAVVGQKWPPNASSGAPDEFARCLLGAYFMDLFLGGHFSNTLRRLVPQRGLEPPTLALRMRCSTN
jgi:hypothetical protein